MAVRIAYLMSRFPKISETFILYEMIELERLGAEVDVFPLIHHQEAVRHPEAEPFIQKAHYTRPLSVQVLKAQLYWLQKKPLAYLQSWFNALWKNRASLKFLTRALIVMPVASTFARQIEARGIQHVHAHWATHPALAAYIIHQLTDIPYSFTAHAHDIYVDQTMLGEKMDAAEFVVTISEYNRRFLSERFGNAEKINVIHCGIDPEVFQQRQPNTDACLRLICIASLEEKKGHRYLLEACQQLKQAGVRFECWLIGDGDKRAELEAMAQHLGIAADTCFYGRQPRDQVRNLLQQVDMMVLPSIITKSGKKEGIPVALMEGMATGLPVIATDISGIAELVIHEQTGLLVPEQDAQAIYEAVMRLYPSPELAAQLGKAGRQKVVDEFDLRLNAAQLHEKFVKSATRA